MSVNTVSEQIKGFIMSHFALTRSRNLGNDDLLLKNGILDSLGVLEMVTYLEQEFNIRVTDEELVPENFQTIECITAFIQKKSNANSGDLPSQL